jgi:hypothetical protein
MNYCELHDKEHIMKLISFLYDEVRSSSGDGDALWYSKFYNVKDIFPLIEEFNSKARFPWPDLTLNNDIISWQNNQESIFITNKKEHWDNQPSWQQISIKY